MPDGTIVANSEAERLLDRLPAELADGLSADQRRAIAAAFADRAGGRIPINLRVSVPLLGWRFFFAVLVGHDRRSAARRTTDRQRHPVRTAGNFLFVVAGAMTFYLVALGCFLLWTAVVEF